MTDVFDLRGPEFLAFFMGLSAAGLAAGGAVRFAYRGPFGRPAQVPRLTTAAAAVLAGADRRLSDATVAGLVCDGFLKADVATRRVRRLAVPGPGADPIARSVADACGAVGVRPDRLRGVARAAAVPIEAGLERQELLTAPGQRRLAIGVPLAIAAAVLLVGVVKVGVGVSRDRPVGLLVMLCLVDAMVFLAAFARVPRRTARGDAVLRDLQRDASPLRTSARARGSRLGGDDVCLAVALFGPAGLSSADPQLRDLMTVLTPPASTGGGGDSGSSCGGGGSSCGGGGGGGCGGCGGGGH